MRFALCCLLVTQPLLFAQAEQRTFSAEDDHVERPIVVPASIMEFLARDPDNVELRSPGETLPRSWFLASEIQLKDRERDIVVIGQFPVLGANVTTFWIFRPRGNSFQLLLKVVAHTINIQKSRTARYHDIEALSATAVTVIVMDFKFNGTNYAQTSSKTSPIP